MAARRPDREESGQRKSRSVAHGFESASVQAGGTYHGCGGGGARKPLLDRRIRPMAAARIYTRKARIVWAEWTEELMG
jgi:hypothetical protein